MNTVENLHQELTDSLSRIKLSFAGYEVDIVDFAPDLSDLKEGNFCADEFIDSIEREIMHTQVIYYHNAMEILSNHDQSLRISLEIAMYHEYKIQDLNSELLASLIIQEALQTQLHASSDDIIQAFDHVRLTLSN